MVSSDDYITVLILYLLIEEDVLIANAVLNI